jgi:curli biogenesis system outer membrane secretion channel CsgG
MTNSQTHLAILLTVGLCAYSGFGEELSKGEKDSIFIAPLTVQPSVMETAKAKGQDAILHQALDSLDTQLTTALNATRVFQLVERKRIADLLTEQGLIGVMDKNPTDKKVVEALKVAGAKYAFFLQVDAFEDRTEKRRFQALDRTSIRRSVYLSAVVRVVNTTTSRLLPDSPSVQQSRTNMVEWARSDDQLDGPQIVIDLVKGISAELSQGVVSLLRPAKILTVTGKQIMINRGTDSGFHPDDFVEVFATQVVKDPDSGEEFRNEVLVGRARIVRGDVKQCFGMLEGEDTGVAPMCVVKVDKKRTVEAKVPLATATGPTAIPSGTP